MRDSLNYADCVAQALHSRGIAENWAQSRLSQGWTYGAQRDDLAKTHPCLVPYEELSEEEKDYDRLTSISTIKFILMEGHSIT